MRATFKSVSTVCKKRSGVSLFSVCFQSLVALLLSSSRAEILGTSPPTPNDKTPLELFKEFIASPPAIERLLFRQRVLTDETNGIAVAGWPGTVRVFERFSFARWQPD